MATSERRFPQRDEIAVATSVSALPIFIWSMLATLEAVPAWILKMSAWDLAGVLAYAQAFALLEGGLLALALLLAAAVIPAPILRQRFALKGSVLGLLSIGWWIGLETIGKQVLDGRTTSIATVTAAYLLALALCYTFVYRRQRLANMLRSIIDRLSVLGFVYIALGSLGLAIILLRNLIGVFK